LNAGESVFSPTFEYTRRLILADIKVLVALMEWRDASIRTFLAEQQAA
jgi:hypothetical protein